MRNTARVSVFAVLLTLCAAESSWAQPDDKPANKAEAQVMAEQRMVNEYIDLGEYETARDSLKKSVAQLKAAGSAVRPISAETHVLLGVVYVIGFKDTKKATEHFTTAINIKKDVALPKHANDRAKVVFGHAYEAIHPTIKCDTLMGVFHQATPLAQEGTPTVIEAKLGKYLLDGTMLVMYRGPAGGEFLETEMKKVEGCTYRGEIPAETVHAPKVEYYLEARMKDGRPSARKGKSKTPFVVNVSFGPVADAPEPAPTKVEEEPKETTAKSDEVEDLLLTKPKPGKGSGCAGCTTGAGSATGSWLLAFAVIVGLRRRRRC